MRRAAKAGRDLRAEQKAEAARAVTFREAFETFFEVKRKQLSNAMHLAQWSSTMELYVYPKIGAKAVGEITHADVLAVLEPIWWEKAETAKRVLQRLEAVFKSAVMRGNRVAASPCIGVADELGRGNRVAKHHRAMSGQDLPAFMERLRGSGRMPATRLCLEWLVLTACRSGEARGACWSEIDPQASLWLVPAERMKAREPHRVPLSPRCLTILAEAKALGSTSGLLFPSPRGKQLSDMTLTKVLRDFDLAETSTIHCFRSTFKNWCAEVAKVPDEVSEAALAHAVNGKVRAAYLRTDFLEERRPLMERWATFVDCAPAHRFARQ